MRFNPSKLLPFLGVIALLQPAVSSRAVSVGDIAKPDKGCYLDQCDVSSYTKVLKPSPGDLEYLQRRAFPRPPIPRPGSPRKPNSPNNDPDAPNPLDPQPGVPRIGTHNSPPSSKPNDPPPRIGVDEKYPAREKGPLPRDVPPLKFEEYHANGDKARKRLDDVINRGEADVNRESWAENYKRKQTTISNIRQKNIDIPGEMWKTSGLDPNAKYTQVEFTNQKDKLTFAPNDPHKEPDTVNECSYSKEQKAIFADRNWARQDRLPDGPRLRWSDLTWQQWKEVSEGRPDELKFVIRNNIANTGTRNTMSDAQHLLGKRRDEPGVFFPSDDPKMNEAFTALCGTDNVKGVLHMLADHHNELGGKKISKIHTYPENKDMGTDPTILLELA